MGSVRRPARDIGREVEQFRRGAKWRPRKNPCERPPGQPDFAGQPGPMDFEVRFRVREAKTHLEYYGYAVWNEQSVDSNGLPGDFEVDRYHLQWKVTTDAAGNNYAHESGEKVRGHKTVHVADDNKNQSIEVTGANGGTFKLEYGGEETANIAHNATAAQVKTALVALAGVAPGDLTESGGPLGQDPVTLDWTGDGKTPKLVVTDDDLTGNNPLVTTLFKDKYRVDFGRMWQPKRLYVSARLRVRAGAGCWSDWSLWTPGVHPTDGTSDPVPPIPNNTSLTFGHIHATRSDPLQGIVAGDYVGNWDVPGGDLEDDMARYHIQLQHSKDGGTNWEWPPQKHSVRDKDDNDNRWRAIFRNAHRKWDYRYRVCSEDRFNRRGPWGPGTSNLNQRLDGWSATVDPATANDPPPAPTIITADIDAGRLHLEVDDYPGVWKDRIEYYEWEVYYGTVSAPNLKQKDRFHRGTVKVFPLRKPRGQTVIARVRSYTASDEASGWQQVTCTAATPPLPSITGATWDVMGPRHNRYRAIVAVTVNDVGHNDHVDNIRVQLAHKPTTGTPTGSDKKQARIVDMNDDPTEAIFKSIPKAHFVYARCISVDRQGRKSAWTSWTAMGKPKDSGATSVPPTPATGGTAGQVTVTTPAPRRVVANWDDPEDDEATRWRVVFKRGSTTVDTQRTRNTRAVYRVPKADVGQNHTAEVYAINDLGVESTVATATGVPPDDDVAGTGEGFDVGDIKEMGKSGVPSKWLRCNGNNWPVSSYPDLYGVIGNTYGGTPGVNFNTPDMNGRHPMGDGTVKAMGDNEGDAESNRSDSHIHGADSTETTPASDETDGFPTSDSTPGTPGSDATSGGGNSGNADNANPTDSSPESAGHNHSLGMQTGSSGNDVNRQTTGASTAGPAHAHNVPGPTGARDINHDHAHPHQAHPHHHGHPQHPHGHGHGNHPHGHGHGGHKHGHGHGKHPHPHPHDNKKRPHNVIKYIIKALP